MKATLDGIEDDVVAIKSDIESLTHEVSTISAKMDALLLSLGITFNASNEIISNGYTAHKHTYIDTTIADTETGGSSPSNTTKITSGVA